MANNSTFWFTPKLKEVKTLKNLISLKTSGNRFPLVFEIVQQPKGSDLSYTVRYSLSRLQPPKVEVVDPKKLKLAPDRKKLPHVYSTQTQWLCLYKIKDNKYSHNDTLTSTLIPWTETWLFYYELWTSDGKWLGPEAKH